MKKIMKMDKFIGIIKPNYQYIKLVPSSAIKDYDSSGLSIISNQIYKKLMQRITREEKKFFYEVKSSIKYLICISKKEVCFYYIIPQVHVNLALEAISKVWNGKCTAKVVDEKEVRVLDNPIVYSAEYKYEDFMSIKTDSKSNTFLAKALSVVEILESDDEVQIAINMIPYDRNSFKWRNYYNDMHNKYKQGLPIIKDKKSISYIWDMARYLLTDALDGIIEGIRLTIDKDITKEKRVSSNFRELTPASKAKEDAGERLIDTQIVVMSSSENKTRKNINARAVCNSFNEVRGDNEFIFKKSKQVINIKKRVWPVNINIMNAKENANFISIPGQTILDELKIIEHINTHEVPAHEQLLTGIVPYGNMTYKGEQIPIFLNENGELAYLPIIIMTKQGGGKTTWFENVGVRLMNNFRNKMKEAKPAKKESLFVIDFIKNCEMSYNIMNNIAPEDIVKIDLSKYSEMQGIGFNEIEIDFNDNEDRLEKSSDQSQEMMKFIDTINEKGEPLSPKMRRYFNAACRICFIHPYQSLMDVIQILEYADIRKKYIDMIPKELYPNLSNKVFKLNELDDGEGGTKTNLIQGILDRVGLLEENSILERMYNKSTKENINLAKCMQEGKAIFILMPQNKFHNPMVKNILVTYFISKLFIASIMRADNISAKQLTRCTLIIDEISQAKGSYSTFNEILTQLRKFKIRPILSAHNWQQINYFEKNLNDSGLSVILPQGSNKSNFEKLKEEFKHNGFELDDLLNLKKWNSLNAVQTDKGFTSFISQFPGPVKGKIEDREDITLNEFKEDILARIEAVKPAIEEIEELDNIIKVDFNKKEVEEILVKEVVNEVVINDDEFKIIDTEDKVINFELDIQTLLLPAPQITSVEDEEEFEIIE